MKKIIKELLGYAVFFAVAIGISFLLARTIESYEPDPDSYTITSLNVDGDVLTCIQLSTSTLSCNWANINKGK